MLPFQRSKCILTCLALTSAVPATSWIPNLPNTRIPLAERTKNNVEMTLSMSSESPEISGKDIYQRVFHRLSAGSDVDSHDALVVEERVRFQPDPSKGEGYIMPVGPCTLILRDGKVEDGEIGDELFRLDVQDGREKHNGAGDFDTAVATILYLASNPKLLKGDVLELGCDLGLCSLLACIAAGEFEEKEDGNDSEEVDILTIPKATPVTNELGRLTLSGDDEERLNLAMVNAKTANVPTSKLNIQYLDWSKRTKQGIPKLYKTIVASDLDTTFPKAKELARTVAHRLQGTASWQMNGAEGFQPTFVHVAPDSRQDIPYLLRFLEKGFRMILNNGYMKVEKLRFVFQMLPQGEPEEKLEDEEIEVQEFQEVIYQTLTAYHHPEYADGAGEIFFPLETGAYEASGGNTYLEPEAGGSPF